MRYWLVLGLMMSAVACSSDGSSNDDTEGDNDGGDIDRVVETATCQELYDRDNLCMTEAGCGNAFNENQFVDGCEGSRLSPKDLGAAVSLSCDAIMLELCSQSAGLFSMNCCKAYFTCPSGQVCEPLDDSDPDSPGVCVTNTSSFPTGAKDCTGAGQCGEGFICLEGSSSTKCAQVCAP